MIAIQDELAAFVAGKLAVSGAAVSSFRRHIGGFSWETYELGLRWPEAGVERECEVIVHRAPEAGLLEPYDARPVYELRRALEQVDGVPVPPTLWLDAEGEATGRPLYVVDKVVGEVPSQWGSDTFFADEEARRDTARQLMRIAAALHAAPVELAPDGLRGSGPTPFRMVERWHEIYERDCLEPVPVLDWGFAWLERNRDLISDRTAIVHGDFRTGNYMMRDGRIVALLDFEEAHVGDPVQDLAHCALRLFRGRTRMPSGLVPLGDLLAMYEEESGAAVPHEAFYFWSVFQSVYSAVTLHRAAQLFARGRTSDVRYPALGYQAYHIHRHVIDYIEAAEKGAPPE
jgi:aminoglycoside phosphotransferase (APT) family kinase protein